jgi:hypothetical protein
MTAYLLWQLLYYRWIIVARSEKIKQGRTTSFTFLINDKKHLIGKIAAKVPEGIREVTFMVRPASLPHSLENGLLRGAIGGTSSVYIRDTLTTHLRTLRFQILVLRLPSHTLLHLSLERFVPSPLLFTFTF